MANGLDHVLDVPEFDLHFGPQSGMYGHGDFVRINARWIFPSPLEFHLYLTAKLLLSCE